MPMNPQSKPARKRFRFESITDNPIALNATASSTSIENVMVNPIAEITLITEAAPAMPGTDPRDIHLTPRISINFLSRQVISKVSTSPLRIMGAGTKSGSISTIKGADNIAQPNPIEPWMQAPSATMAHTAIASSGDTVNMISVAGNQEKEYSSRSFRREFTKITNFGLVQRFFNLHLF